MKDASVATNSCGNGYNYPTARPQDATEEALPNAAIMSRFMNLRQIFARRAL